jgi:hypothetical protein
MSANRRLASGVTVLAALLVAGLAVPTAGEAQEMAVDTVPDAHRAHVLFLQLLVDEHVLERIEAVPELRAAWADEAIQHHFEMMRRMHMPPPAEAIPEEQVEDHRPVPPPDVDHRAMHEGPAMHQAMGFILHLLDDPQVQHRIQTVPEYHSAWADAVVQAHVQRMREKHGGGGHPHH